MGTYCIIPARRGYRVEAIAPDGHRRLIKIWPTKEAAMRHMRSLIAAPDLSGRVVQRGLKGAQMLEG